MSEFRNIPTPGSEAWDDNVPTAAALPLTNNQIGDKRQALDTQAIYSWNGTGWTLIASPAAATAITALIGDVTATGPGAANTTLKTVNLNVGSFGTASSVPTVTVNGKGLTTGVVETPIQIAQSQVDNLVSDLAGKFNNPTGTAADYVAGDGTILPFPSVGAADRLVTTAYNETGSVIPKMSVVYLDGPHGNLPKMVLAQADSDANSALTYGITQSAIGDMNSGIVVEAGRLENLDTNIAGWNEGDILYLSPTVPGGITTIKPSAPDHMVFVGILIRKHPTQGVIQVKIQNGYELDELHNVQILTPPADGSALVYEASTSLWKPSTTKLTKGTKTIFCIDNGDYATLQDAVNAASGGDTILVGIKTGGWGNITVPAGKTLSIVGLTNPRYPGITPQVGSITFSPTTGANPNLNELHLCNLYVVAPAGSYCLTYSGSAPSRIRVNGCYFYSNSATSIIITNTSATFSSAVFNDCEIQSSTSTNTHISAACRLVTINRCVFNNGNKAADITAGVFEFNLCRLEVNNAGAIVTISSGALAPTYVSMGSCLVYNTTANSSGVSLTKGAQSLTFVNISNVFNIPAGTGFCVSGSGGGTNAYSYNTFIANSRFQNSGGAIINVPLTVTPTLV